MKTILLKYVSVALASTIKFFGGPITGAILELNWLATALSSAIGMMFTVLTVTYAGGYLQTVLKKYRKSNPKRFTKTNRTAVQIWNKFGIIGIAFLTPPLFTPIFGTILAVALRAPRIKIFFWMSISAVSWGLLISFLAQKLDFIQNLIK